MLTDQTFKDLLSKYQINPELRDYFKHVLREPIERAITSYFGVKPNYRYGGSLAKDTANNNSCDVDLLVYFDSTFQQGVADIYNNVAIALSKAGYLFEKKNSAIKVYGKDYNIWKDISVDVVPGKFSGGEIDSDVYLYCNKDDSRLKSNPEKHINKVRESGMKEVIRLIKIFRSAYNFKFKSFFLEMFAIDVVEPFLEKDSSLVDKLISFAKHFSEIGVTKIYDPANPNGNNIMRIQSDNEFQIIRSYIKKLCEVLLTDDNELVEEYLLNKVQLSDVDQLIKDSYKEDAKRHSPLLTPSLMSPAIRLSCFEKNTNKEIFSEQEVKKNVSLIFTVSNFPWHADYEYEFIVSNAGFEARKAKQPRGKTEMPDPNNKYIREEHTLYNGNHYVQAIGKKNGKPFLYSNVFIVKVRDFD